MLFELIIHSIHFPSGTSGSAPGGEREERMKKSQHLEMLTQRNKLDIIYKCLFLQRNAFKNFHALGLHYLIELNTDFRWF